MKLRCIVLVHLAGSLGDSRVKGLESRDGWAREWNSHCHNRVPNWGCCDNTLPMTSQSGLQNSPLNPTSKPKDSQFLDTGHNTLEMPVSLIQDIYTPYRPETFNRPLSQMQNLNRQYHAQKNRYRLRHYLEKSKPPFMAQCGVLLKA